MRRRHLLPAVALVALGRAARAQDWPTRPIRLIVPFPAGGTADLLGRLAADLLAPRLGQPVIVENIPGAGGSLGAERVARSAPDGNTLLLSNMASLAIRPAVSRNIAYDSVRDFTHIGLVAMVPSAIAVAAAGPFRSLAELLERARAQPGSVRFGSPGLGSTSHVELELLERVAGVDVTHLPYAGLAPALAALFAGEIEGVIASLPALAGEPRLRLLAVTVAPRLPRWPEVPGVAELNLAGLAAASWFGISGPAGIPPEIAQKINAALVAGLNLPETAQRLEALGAAPNRMPGPDYAALIAAEVPRWADVARAADIQVD